MKMFMKAAVCLALLSMSAFAADPSGKWVAEMTGRDGEKRTTTFQLKADGTKLTGTVSNPMGEREIQDGKVEGDAISFSVSMEMGGETRKMQYSGTVSGTEMKLKVGAGQRSRDVVAKRAES